MRQRCTNGLISAGRAHGIARDRAEPARSNLIAAGATMAYRPRVSYFYDSEVGGYHYGQVRGLHRSAALRFPRVAPLPILVGFPRTRS